jgi:hypothetical protein
MIKRNEKKELFFLLLTVGGLYFIMLYITGCTEPTVSSKTTNHTIPEVGNIASEPLKVCVIEGCEYFICKNHKGNILCHKGNCSNPIHKGGNK